MCVCQKWPRYLLPEGLGEGSNKRYSREAVLLDQAACADGNKEQHSITSRPAFFFFCHSSFVNSALGESAAEMIYGDMQMCTGDKVGSVL